MSDRISDLIAACRSPELAARVAAHPASADRDVPAAREWLRRWAPKPMAPQAAECGCAAGRCGVCN